MYLNDFNMNQFNPFPALALMNSGKIDPNLAVTDLGSGKIFSG